MKQIFAFFIFIGLSFCTLMAQNQDFVTVWNMSNPDSLPAGTIGFNLGTSGSVNYTWSSSTSTATGSGTLSAGAVLLTGLPTSGNVILRLAPTNLQSFYMHYDTYAADQRLVDVTQWGTAHWTSMEAAFFMCDSLSQITANDIPDLSGVSSMWGMFYDTEFNSPVGNWDVSNVTNMDWMFTYTKFNQPIANWDVSNVVSMKSMFDDTPFNQPIGNWDVSNVTNMNGMFSFSDFNQPIDNWDVGNVTNMGSMFNGAQFNQPIGNWDVSNVTYMSNMFHSSTQFNHPIGNWDVSSATHMGGMFQNAYLFNQPIGNWDVSNVKYMDWMFGYCRFNQSLESWSLDSVRDISYMFDYSDLDCANYSSTLIGWANNPATPNGLSLGALQLEFGTNAVVARNILRNTKGWNIVGDYGLSTSCGTTDISPDLAAALSLSPNPNNGNFRLSSNIRLSEAEITLRDALGKTIYTENLQEFEGDKTLYLEGIPTGIYFLNIKQADKTLTMKVVVE